MLGLRLRDEFSGTHMSGTAIELRTSDNQGAAQKSPDQILSITYPTGDVLTALKAISVKNTNTGRPIVLMGDRGRGKSHIMAVMHHAVKSPEVVEAWLKQWGDIFGTDDLKNLEILKGYLPISEPVHNHEYELLWDLLFDRHPRGEFYRGQFEMMNQPFPPRTLLEKMFQEQPTCLILDEFQRWYSGLPETNHKTGLPLKSTANNFIQILSELAKDQPQNLILVVSVFDANNEAYQEIKRPIEPRKIDFHGPSAKQDRQKLLLHRLFENRRNIPESDIVQSAGTYASERFRLLHTDKSEAERERIQQEVFTCWPFSPELFSLLEDQILLSSAAQETRDLIRILAQVFKTRGDSTPIITPSDFFVDGETDEVQTLVDSIASEAGQEKLLQIAQKNLEAVRDSEIESPHARELVSAIWMRSMSPQKGVGGTPTTLHLDITRESALDDNAFQAELMSLIENSFNIHGDPLYNAPLRFDLNENPRSKVRASAKNPKLWQPEGVLTAGLKMYPGKDIQHIRKTLKHLFCPDKVSTATRVIILGPNWRTDPWGDVEELDLPRKWDGPVLLVIPEQIEARELNSTLGPWLAKHVEKRRNTIRFLLPAPDAQSLYSDADLLFAARCSFLCSPEAWGTDSTYRQLLQDFDRPLRNSLKSRFNRFAILHKWDFQQPQNCQFDMEKISEQGGEIPSAVETKIRSALFDKTAFERFVLIRAQDSDTVGSLMDDLTEPPASSTEEAIPFLGETRIFEDLMDLAAQGKVALNVRGTWIGRRPEDASDEDALHFIRRKAFGNTQENRSVLMGLPSVMGGGAVTVPNAPASGKPLPSLPPEITFPKPTGNDGDVFPPQIPAPDDSFPGTVREPDSTGGNGGFGSPSPVPRIQNRKLEEPATGINLSGCFESWGIASSQTLETARIEFSGLTAQQIKLILQRIPSTFRATLEIAYQEGDVQ